MTKTPEPRWRRLGPDERRQQILAAAVRQFGDRPYATVSVAEIAGEAGVARGLVNHYFGSKRDLYLEVVRTMMFVPRVDARDWSGETQHERIESAIGWLMDVVEAHGRGWIAVASAGGVGGDPEVQAMLDAADDLAASRVLALVDYSGTPEEMAVAMAAVRGFGGMLKAIARELVERRSISGEQARRQLVVALEAILAELRSPAARPSAAALAEGL